MKSAAIDAFLLKYLKNSKEPTAPQGYKEFKDTNGRYNEGAYNRALNKAYLSKRQAAPAYGTKGTKLADRGLASSGYASYISSMAKNGFDAAKESVAAQREENEARMGASYIDYLKSYTKKQSELKERVKKVLLENSILDKEAAILYAKDAGLSENDASEISESIYKTVRPKIIRDILNRVAELRMDEDGAALYAKGVGLDASDVKFVKDAAVKLRDNYREYSDRFFEYLDGLIGDSNHILQ